MRALIASLAHFCDSHGGVQRVVQDEAIELRDRGWEVWVIAAGKGPQSEHELSDGIHLLRYVPQQVSPWNPARRFVHQRAASAVLARHLPKIDAVHGHAPLSYLAAIDLYGRHVPRCYTLQSPVRMEMAIVWRNSGFFRRLVSPIALAALHDIEEECVRRSNVLTALSQFTIDCVAKVHSPQMARRFRVTPAWCETSKYIPIEDRARAKRELGWPTDIPVLFTLRRLVPRMGLDRLLIACSLLHRQGVPFHMMIGGAGPLRAALEEQARQLGLSLRVSFLGRIDDQLLPMAYGACDAFLLPTAELECFGLIALEALASGRPVLATPVGSIPEIMSRFESGWLSRSAGAEDFADLMRSYFSGTLPEHTSAELHERTHREYGRWKLLPAFVDSTFGALFRN